MKVLNPQVDLGAFWKRLAASHSRVLFLDYDGTLAPFRVDRHQATPYPGVREALAKLLAAKHTRVAVVSGRSVDDLVPLLGLDPPPEIWGSHGLERLHADGSYEMADLPEETRGLIQEAKAWLDDRGWAEASELKPGALAVHWRGLKAPQARDLRESLLTKWETLADEVGLELREFDGGLELRTSARHKGHAVQTILSESEGAPACAYLGDDLTDEDAFRALEGRGLRVLVRQEFRSTVADIWLVPPDELLDFLTTWHKHCGG